MRSVVVVLPASMCAMIPMFRVFWRENLRGISESAGGGGSEKSGCGQRKRASRARAHVRRVSCAWRYVLEESILARRATQEYARMSGALPGAEGDDSKGPNAARGPSGAVLTVRLVLAVLGAAGAVLLLVASFATVIEITVGTTSKVVDADTAQSGWDRHGPALILLGLLALWLLAVGLRGSRTALVGLVLTG